MKLTTIISVLFLLLFCRINRVTGQISGSKTVGGVSPDYATLTDAVNALETNTIDGPITFNIRPGTYNERISITEITGAGPDDTITFQAESGKVTDVIVTDSATSTSDNYVIALDGGDYVVIRNITIYARGTTYGTVILLKNGATNNKFRNNNIKGKVTSSTSDDLSVVMSEYGSVNNHANTYTGNTIENGSAGLNCEGYSTRTSGTMIKNNKFLNQYRRGIECNNQESLNIINNYFESNSNNQYYYGMAILTSNDGLIKNNNIQLIGNSGGYGMLFNSCSGTGNLIAANNFIHIHSIGNNQIGLKSENNSNVKFYYNSVNLTGNSPSSKAFHLVDTQTGTDVINNILINQSNGYVYYIESIVNQSDYNNLYATGSLFSYWGQEYSDLTSWINGTSADQNSISADPYFWSNSDLHTANTVLQAGTDISSVVGDDIDGEIRNTDNPCMGADEFVYPALGGNYTIGSSGDYSNFTEAVQALVNGGVRSAVTFNIEPGSYNEQIIIPEINNTSASNTIIFRSVSFDSTSVVLYKAPVLSTDDYIIRLNGADHVSFEHITVRSEGTEYGIVIELLGGAGNISFLNCRIEGSSSPTLVEGILMDGSGDEVGDTIHIMNCVLENGTCGIYLQGPSDGASYGYIIQDNRILNQVDAGMELRRIDAQLVKGNYLSSQTTDTYYGIWLFYCDSSILIESNRIYAPQSKECYGIFLFNSNGKSDYRGLVCNNHLSLNIDAAGIYGYGIVTWNSTYQNILYNSINLTGSQPNSRIFYIRTGSSGISILNNIFSNKAGGYSIFSEVTSGIGSDFNDLYTNGSNLGYWNSADQPGLNDWQTASGQDANSVSIDPQFSAADDPHFPNPILNDAGTPLAEVIDDIDGEMRDPTAPDIGADEFCLPSIADDKSGCTARTIPDLTATGSNVKWYSDGDLTTMVHSGSNFSTGHTATGTYTYYVTQTINESESQADTVILTINTTPGSPSATDETICFGESTPDLQATGTDIKWYDDETMTNLVHTGTSFATGETDPGAYTWYVIQTQDGCESDPDTSVLTIHPIPDPPEKKLFISCFGDTVPDLIAEGENVKWYSDQELTNLVHIGDTFSSGDTLYGYYAYYPTQTVNGCESGPSFDTLWIKPRPDEPLADSQLVCIGENVPDLTATGTDLKWYEDAEHETFLQSGNTYTTGKTDIGVYTYYVTQTVNGCESLNKLVALAINGLPVPDVIEDQVICEVDTQEFQLSATTAEGHSYSWTSSQGDLNSSEANPFVKPTAPGSYEYFLTETIDSTGCLDKDTVTITINPDPMATVLANQVLCQSEIRAFQLGASAIAGNSYSWVSNPVGFVNAEANPTATPTESITYILTETVDLTGCHKTDSVTFTINPNPEAAVLDDQTICHSEVQPFSLGTAAVSGNSYSWTSSQGDLTSSVANPVVESSEPGTYKYFLVETIDATGCDKSDSVIIVINPNPVVSITAGQNPIDRDSSTALNASGAQSYLWSPATGLSSTTGSQVTADPDEITTYIVEGTNNFGCTGTDTIILYVYCPECGNETFFTANGSFNFGCTNNLYKNNLNCSWTILPSGVDSIHLNFKSTFDIRSGDYIKVYNGSNAQALLIGSYNNDNLPPELISSGSTMFIQFVTDDHDTGLGFQARWSNDPEFTGIDNISQDLIKIYPNPANDKLFIEINDLTGNDFRLFIYNRLGQMIQNRQLENPGGQIREELDISDFKEGVYLIRIVTSEDIYVQKVIKE